MKLQRLTIFFLLTLAAVLASADGLRASDAVEWSIIQTLKLDASPIDVAVSADGRRLFVLTDQGKVIVYSAGTEVEGTVDVGADVDKIRLNPEGDVLIANSRADKTVKFFDIDFIQHINIAGSPFKGPADAPVVIAVFDDFQ
jgi:DNA-binding beta-propeller fold protein YncE